MNNETEFSHGIELLIRQGYEAIMDDYVHNENYLYRLAIASKGMDRHLDILVHDENNLVRITVAEKGRPQDLDILINDPDPFVRAAVAKHQRFQDLLLLKHDESDYVRDTANNVKPKRIVRYNSRNTTKNPIKYIVNKLFERI